MLNVVIFNFVVLVFVVFAAIFGISADSAADVQLSTKTGQTMTWEQFTLEDGNYCTWKNGGKFCVSQGEVVAIKEVEASGDSYGGTQRASQNSSQRGQQGSTGGGIGSNQDTSASKGTIIRGYGHTSGESTSTYGYGGGYDGGRTYNRDSSGSMHIQNNVTESDVRRMELEESDRRIKAEDRRREMEQKAEADRALESARRERERREWEQQREWNRVRIR